MPNALTHYVFAEKLFDSLPQTVRSHIEGYEKFYYFGSMGGDVLYGLNFSSDKKKREYGDFVHQKNVGKSFNEALNKDLEPSQYAFVLGFLTHYVLDSSLHPYIFFAQESKVAPNVSESYKGNVHMLVETEMDAYTADKRFGKFSYPAVKLFSWDKDIVKATFDFYNTTCKESFNFDFSEKDAHLAVNAWNLFTRLLQKGCFLKTGISVIAEKVLSSPHLFTAGYRKYPIPPEWDLGNQSRMSYPINTKGEIKADKTLAEQYNDAIQKGIKYMTVFVETKDKKLDKLDLDFSTNYDGYLTDEQ